MARILSVDIGTKNLAVAVFESHTAIKGRVFDIRMPTVRESTETAVDIIAQYLPLSRILIEQQPAQNLRMNPIMHGLVGAARAWGIETSIVSPQLRQRVLGLANYRESSYAQRKKAAVTAADKLFPNYRSWLEAGQKADDLADALLQYVVWKEAQETPVPKRRRKNASPVSSSASSVIKTVENPVVERAAASEPAGSGS